MQDEQPSKVVKSTKSSAHPERSRRVHGDSQHPKTSRRLATITTYCQKHRLIKPESTIIIGLSGGPDSVCLTSVLKKLQEPYKLKLITVHIDHEWRTNSGDDAEFCKQFATSLSLPFHCIKASEVTLTKKYNGSQEELGRHLRRQALEEIARHYKADAIALGHHADDQQETFFLRMIRGASIAGLSAMRSSEGGYIRPLLETHKSDILNYLTAEHLSYVIDSTNESDVYLRNALRLHVLPALKSSDDRFDKNFFKTLGHIQETEDFIERQTTQLFSQLTHTDSETLWLDYKKLLSTDPFMHHPILIKWLISMGVPFTPSTGLLDEIIRFFKNRSTKHALHANWAIETHGNYACIRSAK